MQAALLNAQALAGKLAMMEATEGLVNDTARKQAHEWAAIASKEGTLKASQRQFDTHLQASSGGCLSGVCLQASQGSGVCLFLGFVEACGCP